MEEPGLFRSPRPPRTHCLCLPAVVAQEGEVLPALLEVGLQTTVCSWCCTRLQHAFEARSTMPPRAGLQPFNLTAPATRANTLQEMEGPDLAAAAEQIEAIKMKAPLAPQVQAFA